MKIILTNYSAIYRSELLFFKVFAMMVWIWLGLCFFEVLKEYMCRRCLPIGQIVNTICQYILIYI